jgi:hypothetical protein
MFSFEISKDIFKDFNTFTIVLLILFILCTISLLYYWKADSRREKIRARYRILSISGLAFACLFAWLIRTQIVFPYQKFPDDQTGIIVLKLIGDDDKNTTRRHLIASLNENLKSKNIIIKAVDRIVDEENFGKTTAHAKARRLGKKYHATLALWGNLKGDNIFHPRLTAIKEHPASVNPDSTLRVMDISDMQLPAEIAVQPIKLATFLTGYNFYMAGQFHSALNNFSALQNSPSIESINPATNYAA